MHVRSTLTFITRNVRIALTAGLLAAALAIAVGHGPSSSPATTVVAVDTSAGQADDDIGWN